MSINRIRSLSFHLTHSTSCRAFFLGPSHLTFAITFDVFAMTGWYFVNAIHLILIIFVHIIFVLAFTLNLIIHFLINIYYPIYPKLIYINFNVVRKLTESTRFHAGFFQKLPLATSPIVFQFFASLSSFHMSVCTFSI